MHLMSLEMLTWLCGPMHEAMCITTCRNVQLSSQELPFYTKIPMYVGGAVTCIVEHGTMDANS